MTDHKETGGIEPEPKSENLSSSEEVEAQKGSSVDGTDSARDVFDPLAEMSVEQAVEASVKAYQQLKSRPQADAVEGSQSDSAGASKLDQSCDRFSGAEKSEALSPCPECGTMLEPFQIVCHKCQHVTSEEAVPVVHESTEDTEALEGSCQDWLDKGMSAMNEEHYAEAQACFVEALYRSRSLPDSLRREIVLRKQLAKALEKQEKRREASEQYARLYQIKSTMNDSDSSEFEKRARQLSMSTVDAMAAVGAIAQFRPVQENEAQVVPLYCSQCKRLLLEAEVYGFRNGKLSEVRCFCGYEGKPLVRTDESYIRALKHIPEVTARKAKLIDAASGSFQKGKKRSVAILLAVLLGTLGVHKLYLGERAQALVYALLFWTGLPTLLGLFDAFHYFQMSPVTFNMTFNIEEVLKTLPEEAPAEEAKVSDERFSMEVDEQDSEDMVDQFSTSDRRV